MLEWVAIPFSRESSWSKDQTRVSYITGRFFTIGVTREAHYPLDLTEAEDIKKEWQEYTEELYKKYFHDPDNHDGVITHLEPDILEGKVKWALGSIAMNKASGGNGIPVELFQILKDDVMEVLQSIRQWPQE